LNNNSQIEKSSLSGRAICRRMFNMNLALGYSEEFYTLDELAEIHKRSKEDIFKLAFDYVQARACFKKEWDKMKDPAECPLPNNCLINECFKERKCP
jgi:hypothetical protein